MPRQASHSSSSRAAAGTEQAGWRADRALCALVPALNRRTAKLLFHARLVRLNGRTATGAERVTTGDQFEFPASGSASLERLLEKQKAPRLVTPHGRHLTRLYEDDDILVISKPAEVPVHRGQGGFTRRDTLEDVLTQAYPPRESGRQGYYFVHRLDMETSGCLLIAKTEQVRDALIKAFSERKVHKEYLAIVVGEVPWEQLVVEKPIAYVRQQEAEAVPRRKTGRDRRAPVMRGLKMGVALEEGSTDGKPSQTHFQVLARYRAYTLVRAQPKTGRTHQIRVHLAGIGHPLAYDPLYGRRSPVRFRELDPRAGESEAGEKVVLNRLPLHAWKVGFTHPVSGQALSCEASVPRDLKEFLELLKKHRSVQTQW